MRQLKLTETITQRDTKSIDKYFREISKIPLLSQEEEIELAIRARAGDQKALLKLVRSNLRFVVSVAKQYQNVKLSLADLINEGNIGLITAASRFDPSRGFKFISYAVWWIRQSIQSAISEYNHIVRLPANQVSKLSKINRVADEIRKQHERSPTGKEIRDITGIDEINYRLITQNQMLSLDLPFSDLTAPSYGNDTLLDVLENKENIPVDHNLTHNESLSKELKGLLTVLSEKERYILIHNFGIGTREKRLDDIAIDLNLTRERVRQLKKRAIRKLQNRKEKLVEYLN